MQEGRRNDIASETGVERLALKLYYLWGVTDSHGRCADAGEGPHNNDISDNHITMNCW